MRVRVAQLVDDPGDFGARGGNAGVLEHVVRADMDQGPVGRVVAQPVHESGKDLVRPEARVTLVIAVDEGRARTGAGPSSLPMKSNEQSAAANAASRSRR